MYIYSLLLFYIAENSNYKSISLDDSTSQDIERNFLAYGNVSSLFLSFLPFSSFLFLKLLELMQICFVCIC